MPWVPELFSAPVLERILRQGADARVAGPVPYFAGVQSGESDALVKSFAGEPELHHPIRGRVKGRRAFERFVTETNAWLVERNALVSHVERIITPPRGVEETVLTLDGDQGRIELPVAIVADRDGDARIIEIRIYHGAWPLTGRHANRPPLLQPDPDLHPPDVVGEYQRALAAGDVEAAAAAFQPDAYVRAPRRRAVRPPHPRRVGRPVRAVLFERGRHPVGALRRHRRRPLVRIGIQPRPVGPDRTAARGRHRSLRSWRHRQTRRRPHLLRRRPTARPGQRCVGVAPYWTRDRGAGPHIAGRPRK